MSRMDQMFPATDKISVDSVLLVREVKKYPIIYNFVIRRDSYAVCRAWEAIVSNLVPQFLTLNEDDQKIIRNNIRKRWSWMRGILQRDLAKGKEDMHGHLNWMQELKFMVPVLVQKRQANFLYKFKPKERITSTVTSTTTLGAATEFNPSSTPSRETMEAIPREYDFNENNKLVDLFISKFRSEVLTSSIDQDVQFLDTLLHIYRKCGHERKLLLKQKFQKILHT